MGDISVDIFQETLKELITSTKLSLITEEKHQLQSLEEEIKYLRRFLQATEKKRNDHPEVMKLVMQIRDLISDAENILELFVVHAFRTDHAYYSLESVKERMKILTAEVQIIYDENMYDINGVEEVKQVKPSSAGIEGSAGSSRGSHTSKVIKEKVVMGFEEDIEKLIAKLDEGEGEPLEIISIIGPGGGGKTTLARQVYDHTFTSRTFEIRAWVDVSQGYDITRKRYLLIRILESIIPGNYENSSDDKLAEDILKCLKGRKYLIVMDDIWGIEAWNAIERSFPKEDEGSKVLFTSRLLVQLDGVRYFPHYLAPLPKNVCWELLQKQVFGMECCPPELVDVGEQIAEKCKGLPLAVVTIAGILATEDKTLNVWEKVAKHLSSIIAKNQEGCMEILELSYNHMPLHLKACFLYIGGYPEDNEIPIRELIWLWIAEGFIQQNDGGESLETIAKDYLIDLIDRSLVQATKGPLGGIKECRIHDLLRELCLKKAKDDHFFVKNFENDYVPNPNTKQRRRLLIGNHFFENFSLKPENLRSFLCLGGSAGRFKSPPVTNLSFFVENFKLLRVLSFVPLKCEGKIGTGHLVHLRYLAYEVGNVSWTIPFSKFLNLETLYLNISMPRNVTVAPPYLENGEMIQLPCDIFKMVKLRHLYTKRGQFTFHHSSEETGGSDFDCSSKLDSLQTLHRICACEACRSFLVRTPNLRKLGLYGGKITEDNNVLRLLELECLKCLEKLTFSAHYKLDSTVESTLLPGLKLPLTITRITFKYTRLKWEELSRLHTLPSLEVLRLLYHACAGPVWDACARPVWDTSELVGFPQLKYLRLKELDIVEWNASEEQFPKLEVLVVEACLKLEQIPIDFGNLNELREIKLEFCRSSAEESARKIQENQSDRNGDDDCLNLLARWNHENSDSEQ